jgi:hypothetical protein
MNFENFSLKDTKYLFYSFYLVFKICMQFNFLKQPRPNIQKIVKCKEWMEIGGLGHWVRLGWNIGVSVDVPDFVILFINLHIY